MEGDNATAVNASGVMGSQKNIMSQVIDDDIDDLLRIKTMPTEEKEELYTKMFEIAQNRVVSGVFDRLQQDDAKNWEEICDREDAAESNRFLKEKGIDLDQMYAQETMLLKIELTQLTAIIDKR